MANDVIDALECCAIENCHECPYRLYFECKQTLARDAVEVIRKLKGESNETLL